MAQAVARGDVADRANAPLAQPLVQPRRAVGDRAHEEAAGARGKARCRACSGAARAANPTSSASDGGRGLPALRGRLTKAPGGAEIRGSTSIAERMPPDEYSRLIARFYGAAAKVVDERDGIVDKFVGDSAVALFIPGFAGSDHATDAIASARALLGQTRDGGGEPWIPVGAAVHTGRCFVGAVGEGDVKDFTALGDAVNTAARLSGLSGAGEILVSADAAAAGGLETGGLERRTLELRGRDQSVDAWVATIG